MDLGEALARDLAEKWPWKGQSGHRPSLYGKIRIRAYHHHSQIFALLMAQSTFPHSVDVLVVGGGPTGLIITYLLLRSGLKVLTIGWYQR
jgi:NADPH-dependent 2,4-dienoyl-CoA reductase/sulfur reductase-like enzyme